MRPYVKPPMRVPIDEIIENGQVFNLRKENVMDDLRRVVRSLFLNLHTAQVDYVLVGGVALLSYVQGRNTQDVNIIIDPAQVQQVSWQAALQDRDFGKANYQGLQVDLLLTTNSLFEHVRQHERTHITFAELDVPCATREGLLLLKLYALPSLYRQGHLSRAAIYETDILMLHQDVVVDDEQLLSTLAQHLKAADIVELRRILDEQRGRRRFV